MTRRIDRLPELDPEHDLKGATPETLARALLRPRCRPLADRVRERQEDGYEPGRGPEPDLIGDSIQ